MTRALGTRSNSGGGLPPHIFEDYVPEAAVPPPHATWCKDHQHHFRGPVCPWRLGRLGGKAEPDENHRMKRPPKRHHAPEKVALALELKAKGLSCYQIAPRVGVAVSTVWTWCKP